MSNIFFIRGFAIFAGGPAVIDLQAIDLQAIDLQAIDLHGANGVVHRSS